MLSLRSLPAAGERGGIWFPVQSTISTKGLRFNPWVILSGGFLDHVVAWCWGAAAAFGAAGSGFGGFRRAGRRAGDGGQAGETPADAAGGGVQPR